MHELAVSASGIGHRTADDLLEANRPYGTAVRPVGGDLIGHAF